jgi:hypothetical protein
VTTPRARQAAWVVRLGWWRVAHGRHVWLGVVGGHPERCSAIIVGHRLLQEYQACQPTHPAKRQATTRGAWRSQAACTRPSAHHFRFVRWYVAATRTALLIWTCVQPRMVRMRRNLAPIDSTALAGADITFGIHSPSLPEHKEKVYYYNVAQR